MTQAQRVKRAEKGRYEVMLAWDDEACVWVATSKDVFGLIMEHESFDRLIENVCNAVPELLAMEDETRDDISMEFTATRCERIALHG